MFIETPRLVLVSTPLNIIRMRLERANFSAEVSLENETKTVRFPADWPSDALVIFPRLAAHLETNPEQELWDGTLIEKATDTAVGQLGCKGLPDENGVVEIGYGLNPEARGRGYATEIVGALTAWLLGQPTVSLVTAECLATNLASVRVLEKTGFKFVGKKAGEEGPLLLWAKGT